MLGRSSRNLLLGRMVVSYGDTCTTSKSSLLHFRFGLIRTCSMQNGPLAIAPPGSRLDGMLRCACRKRSGKGRIWHDQDGNNSMPAPLRLFEACPSATTSDLRLLHRAI